ncbi:MAG: hypothetical protein BWY11_01822 [Firmicutes bacterium ADurb.Bin182]|nr:MAG: hypothetical protein BWY11_01822 [Firmicutes bacterium ADurb.Bin182]
MILNNHFEPLLDSSVHTMIVRSYRSAAWLQKVFDTKISLKQGGIKFFTHDINRVNSSHADFMM